MNKESIMLRDKSDARWREAQAKEESFWRRDDVIKGEMNRVIQRYKKIIEEIELTLNSNPKILDVGCGPTCAARFFTKGKKIFFDPLMSSYKEKYADLPVNDELLRGVGECIPFKDNTFDVILCFNALDHMRNPRKTLDEIRRVLKVNGIFILGVFCHPPIFAIARMVIEKILPFLKERAHPYSYALSSLCKIVSQKFLIVSRHCVYRKESVPKLHREDWVLVCKK